MIRLVLLAAPIYSFNLCSVDPNACIPLEDFQVNCSCILTSKIINATDDTFMFLLGHEIPFNLFKQVEIPQMLRRKLKQRLPLDDDFEAGLQFPEHIVRNLRLEENMVLFLVNSTFTETVLSLMVNESFLTTESIRDFSRWCTEDECNAIIDNTQVHNVTAGFRVGNLKIVTLEGTYSHVADILQVINLHDRSLFAISSVKAEFDTPKVQRKVCESKCTRFQPQDALMCRRLCIQKYYQAETRDDSGYATTMWQSSDR